MFRHGLSRHPLYRKWIDIKGRCYRENTNGYKHWDGRGVKMYKPWINDPKAFIEYVMSLPHYGNSNFKSLDRINNDGDYVPGNLRWTDFHHQLVNQRKHLSVTGYVGVYPSNSRYCSNITVYGKVIRFGTFDTIKEAVNARNNYIISNNLTEYPIQII